MCIKGDDFRNSMSLLNFLNVNVTLAFLHPSKSTTRTRFWNLHELVCCQGFSSNPNYEGPGALSHLSQKDWAEGSWGPSPPERIS